MALSDSLITLFNDYLQDRSLAYENLLTILENELMENYLSKHDFIASIYQVKLMMRDDDRVTSLCDELLNIHEKNDKDFAVYVLSVIQRYKNK